MATLGECNRDNLCVDCDSTTCLRAGDIGADCPKWVCDNVPYGECENCEFIKEYAESYRKELAANDARKGEYDRSDKQR